MFEKLIRDLENLGRYAIDYEEFVDRTIPRFYRSAEVTISDNLVRAGADAFDGISEYNNGTEGAAALRNHLLDNLSDLDHVIIDPETGKFVTLFDEDIAGNYDDLISGMRAAYFSPQPLRRRANFWKYGIYIPSAEKAGEGLSKSRHSDERVDYSDVVRERIYQWGRKAPYWTLIEHGNHGGGYAYPSFRGTRFVQKWRDESREALKELTDVMNRVLADIGNNLEDFPNDDIMWVKITSKTGKIRWQPYSRSARGFVKGVTYTDPNI